MAESESLKRPRFFNGQLLRAEDLELEQQYFLDKSKRHNRSLHGFGIVSGLTVTLKEGLIIVDPGLALDCEGSELVIPAAIPIAPPVADCHTTYVNLRYAEEASTANETATTTEGFEITFAQENCNRGHRHVRGRWLACGMPHALTIAKLKHGAHGWRVERGYRPPVIK